MSLPMLEQLDPELLSVLQALSRVKETPTSLAQLREHFLSTRRRDAPETLLLRETIRLLLMGKRPLPKDVAETLCTVPQEQSLKLLAQLQERGGIDIDEASKRIVRATFVTSEETVHRVAIGESSGAYVWCALDALSLSASMPDEIHITSTCPICWASIRADFRNHRLYYLEPQTSWMFLGVRGGSCERRADVCPYINFFCRREHAEEWHRKNSSIKGGGLSVPEAAGLVEYLFKE